MWPTQARPDRGVWHHRRPISSGSNARRPNGPHKDPLRHSRRHVPAAYRSFGGSRWRSPSIRSGRARMRAMHSSRWTSPSTAARAAACASRLPEARPRARRVDRQRARLPPGPADRRRRLHELRALRPGLPRRRLHRVSPGRGRPDDGHRRAGIDALDRATRPAGPDEGQRGDGRGGDPGRLRRLLRLPDHAPGRAARVDGPPDARAGPGLRPGRERARPRSTWPSARRRPARASSSRRRARGSA